MAEYAAHCGGFPAPSDPWPLFMLGAGRAARFDARAKLHTLEAVDGAIGAAFGGGAEQRGDRDRLLRAAYPVKRSEPVWVENMAAELGMVPEPEADG